MSEQETGTVRTIRDRKTGLVVGYQALLPRAHSTPPEGCTNPDRYQQPIGPRLPTEEEARGLLNAAMSRLTDVTALRNGLPLSSYVQSEIKARLHEALREYESHTRATRAVATWRSIDRVWLKEARFYDWPPSAIDLTDLQNWFDFLNESGENSQGAPLSGNFIRNIAQLLRATFDRAKITPNPIDSIELPAKNKPRFTHLELAQQRWLFGNTEMEDRSIETSRRRPRPARPKIDLEDRTMVGCGMGAGLRVGELLSFEVSEVFLDTHDPYLIVRYGGDHRARTKGRRVRRVELVEPGLGFWRLYMERFYRGGVRVFEGPRGGYLKSWPEKFPEWSDIVGKRITSHIMRHTWAVSMLSGSWGYEPQSLEFVQHQLGHADRSTTERFYGAYENGTWLRQARLMAGRESRPAAVKPVTALELLGLDAKPDALTPRFAVKSAISAPSPSLTQIGKSLEEIAQTDAFTHQSLGELVNGFLRAVQDGDPHALAKGVDLARVIGVALAELESAKATGQKTTESA